MQTETGELQPEVQETPVKTAGESLRAEREARGLSEKEVADKLHITVHYLRSIEENKYEKLPGEVFARGYIKSYAELLDLNPQHIIDQYDAFVEQKKQKKEDKMRRQVKRRKDRNRPWVIASVVLFIAVFVALGFYHRSGTEGEGQGSNLVNQSETLGAGAIDVSSSGNSRAPASSDMAVPGTASAPARVGVADPGEAAVSARDTQGEDGPLVDARAPQPGPATQSRQDDLARVDTPRSELLAPGAVQPGEELAGPAGNPAGEVNGLTPQGGESAGGRIITVSNSGEDVLRITFNGESWVEVNDGDAKQIYRDIRTAGDVLEITGTAPFSILLGDAPLTTLSLNGDEIDVSESIRIDNSARLTVGL